VGRRHEFSAGLLIGGKKVAEEASRVAALNVLIATPGARAAAPAAGPGARRGTGRTPAALPRPARPPSPAVHPHPSWHFSPSLCISTRSLHICHL
jgi:hypothetical protein